MRGSDKEFSVFRHLAQGKLEDTQLDIDAAEFPLQWMKSSGLPHILN